MIKDMIVSSTALETRVAILEDDRLAELYIERQRNRGILANTYKGRVTKVLPGMQSAFVDIGLEKDAFLYVSDFVEESDELDSDLPADDPVNIVESEAEAAAEPRQSRRERRGERHRWRDRRERGDHRAASGDARRQSPAAAQVESRWEFHEDGGFWIRVYVESPTQPERLDSTDPASMADAPAMEAETAEAPQPSEPPQALDEATPGQPVPDACETSTELESASDAAEAPSADGAQALGEDARDASPAASETPASAGTGDASIRDDGARPGFSADKGDSEGGRGSFPHRRGMAARRKRYAAPRHTPQRTPAEHHSIDDMLHEGQEILVQVAKEPIARKGARVTSHIALPGRYLVYMPTVDHIGVSRKIGSDGERMRLKEIILRHRERFPGGVIVRTAAAEHSEEDLVNDLLFLVRIWEDMRTKAERVSAPALVHAEMSLVQRLLRDQFSFEFASIRVDDEMEYQRVVEFVDKIFPDLVHRVKLYTKDNDIFDEYGITPEIDKLLHPKIWLKSGGYIVINQTEALVSIDVNTGKFVGRGNSLEETITRTNLEAVKEIVRQVRLRDLGGIIVVDFIDMDERKNRKRVMEALSEEIARDKAPSKILEFNEFGLVAITRKRVKQSLERSLCQTCPYCSGSGMVKSVSTTCHSIFHEIEKMRGILDDRAELMVRVHPDVAKALRDAESGVLEELRHILRRDVIVKADPALHIEHFNIVN
ncbi:MAG: Rne/Rng family ribonuclease [Acidobacteriota bacterium]|jgi:ribonuclease G|nr:Rne/Rng family ribonuclease [Acidobacteriota bacterium]